MTIHNFTNYSVETLLKTAVQEFPIDGLAVEIRYCPKNSCRFASGTYYRYTNARPDGRLIRIRINRSNVYPLDVCFRTSDYYKKRNSYGQEVAYQKLVAVSLPSPEHLILAIFLHEFSHYLDHLASKNGRYKQTKADKFALQKLKELSIVGAD